MIIIIIMCLHIFHFTHLYMEYFTQGNDNGSNMYEKHNMIYYDFKYDYCILQRKIWIFSSLVQFIAQIEV